MSGPVSIQHFRNQARRVTVTVVAAALLGGCGFSPLYSHQLSDRRSVTAELSRIYVAGMGGRQGQELRLGLQQDLAGANAEHPDGYTLYVNPSINSEVLDIHQDNTSGRTRITASASWSLYTVEQVPKLVAQGSARTIDGYTNTYEQYFAQTLNDEAARARTAQTLADNITQQIAVWFASHTAPANKVDDARPVYARPMAMPNSSNTVPSEKAGADGFPASAIGRETPNADDDQ